MEKGKKSFIMYLDYKEQLEDLSDKELGTLIRAIFQYIEDDTEPSFKGKLNIAFKFIRSALDRDNQKWEDIKKKRSEAGKRHSGNQYTRDQIGTKNGTKLEQNGTNGTNGTVSVNDSVNVNVNDNVSVSVNDNVINNSTFALPTSTPTLTQISDYCQEKGYVGFDYEKFYDYYQANGWLDSNGNKIKYWKAKLSYWYRSDKEKGKIKESKEYDTEMIYTDKETGRDFQYDSKGNKHYVGN